MDREAARRADREPPTQGRESGGRFAWFVELEVGGKLLKIYVRGTRDDSFSYTRIYSTRREARILEVLHREGIRVPQVLAFHEDPQAAVLAHVEGRDDFNNVKDPAEKESILESFLERLAELHAVDARKSRPSAYAFPRRRRSSRSTTSTSGSRPTRVRCASRCR